MVYELLVFNNSSFEKGQIAWRNGIKLFTTFIVVQCQFPQPLLYPNMRLLPGVIVPVYIEFSVSAA